MVPAANGVTAASDALQIQSGSLAAIRGCNHTAWASLSKGSRTWSAADSATASAMKLASRSPPAPAFPWNVKSASLAAGTVSSRAPNRLGTTRAYSPPSCRKMAVGFAAQSTKVRITASAATSPASRGERKGSSPVSVHAGTMLGNQQLGQHLDAFERFNFLDTAGMDKTELKRGLDLQQQWGVILLPIIKIDWRADRLRLHCAAGQEIEQLVPRPQTSRVAEHCVDVVEHHVFAGSEIVTIRRF